MQENIQVSGSVELTIRQPNGKVLKILGDNLVVSGGQNLFAGLFAGDAVDPPSHMACGSSNTAPDKAQTDLVGTEHERVAATVSAVANTVIIEATFGAGLSDPVSIGEFGIFNDASAGDMIARFTTVMFTLPGTSEIDVLWKLTIGS